MTENTAYSDRKKRAFIEDYKRIVLFVAGAWGGTQDDLKGVSGRGRPSPKNS